MVLVDLGPPGLFHRRDREDMTDYIRVNAKLSIKEGKLSEFKEKGNAAIEKVKANEPNMLSYEWYLSEDGSKCYIVEIYKNSDAIMAHMGNVGDLLGPFFELAPLTGLNIYGSPSDEVRQAFASFGAQYHEHFNGFTR
jgi:quinol monooxygenase YgiN